MVDVAFGTFRSIHHAVFLMQFQLSICITQFVSEKLWSYMQIQHTLNHKEKLVFDYETLCIKHRKDS